MSEGYWNGKLFQDHKLLWKVSNVFAQDNKRWKSRISSILLPTGHGNITSSSAHNMSLYDDDVDVGDDEWKMLNNGNALPSIEMRKAREKPEPGEERRERRQWYVSKIKG